MEFYMLTETLTYGRKWEYQIKQEQPLRNATIVFIFGEREAFKEAKRYEEIRELYPHSDIIGCTSSGNILGDSLSSASLVATAVYFEKGFVEVSVKDFNSEENLFNVSKSVVDALDKEGLKHVFLLSDGLNMNGSFLAQGANKAVDSKIPITGGLAGDGTKFEETWVIANDVAVQNRVVGVGFYGDSLSITSGCNAGWEEFGIYRRITKSIDNVVYEIDGQPALDLYKKYLGEYAENLEENGLHFPFSVKKEHEDWAVIRSVLAVNEEEKTLVFAGDMEEGALARLMKADIDGLIDGSEMAARNIIQVNNKNALGLVVSCVGRRVVLNQLSDEELESIGEILGTNVQLTGFYSYGELAPHSDKILSCRLHNQTMTLTVIYED
jgi:hypothetical protein